MAFGGSSEFSLIAGDQIGTRVGTSNLTTSQFGLGGGSIFVRFSSDESTDFMATVGYFTGIGRAPYGGALIYGPGSSQSIGIVPGDIVIAVETTAGARPGRVTLHSCLRSTANFSTASYVSTGGFDVTLSNSCTQ